MAVQSPTAPARTQSAGLLTLLVAYAGFIILGLPDGLFGVAWPSMQQTFGVGKEALGLLLLPGTIGYMLFSFISGRFIGWKGIAAFLLLGAGLRTLGLLGFATVQVWAMLLGINFVYGLGTGGVDSGFNTYIATNYSAGRLSWLHACFGLGATIGPRLMQGVLDAGQSWQAGYLIVGAIQGALALLILLLLSRWQMPAADPAQEQAPAEGGTPFRETLRIPAVWIGVLTFMLYTGLEVTAGTWAFSLFTEVRGISADVAATWTSVYWGSLTVGRFVTGIIVDRLGAVRVLRLSMLGGIVGGLLITVQGSEAISFAGMALLGYSLAAIFPVLIGITPARFGQEHGPNAIGFQIAAAGLGVAILPGLAGVLAGRISLEIIGPFIVVAGLLMWAAYEFGLRLVPVKQG